jgi:hypothetical protein
MVENFLSEIVFMYENLRIDVSFSSSNLGIVIIKPTLSKYGIPQDYDIREGRENKILATT